VHRWRASLSYRQFPKRAFQRIKKPKLTVDGIPKYVHNLVSLLLTNKTIRQRRDGNSLLTFVAGGPVL